MISDIELEAILGAEESDVFERKASLADKDRLRDTIISFANDIAGRGGGRVIVGQGPDGILVGLNMSADEAQRIVGDIARQRIYPAVHVLMDIVEHNGKTVLVIKVPQSVARPHFRGACYVRQGSSNRIATDAETMALRATLLDEKLRQLLVWQQQGQTTVTCIRTPTNQWGAVVGKIVEITPTYVTFDEGSSNTYSVGISELQLGWDTNNKRPRVRYLRDS